MNITKQFEKEIEPFYWVKLSTGASVCLTAGDEYLQEIFAARADEGFIGNGYDWASLAHAFLNEKCPKLQEKSLLTQKQICSVPIPKIKKHWQTLSFFLRKRAKTKQ